MNLDPLSSLDPATRELAQTRLFAERALYLTRKMPNLLRWQTELLALNTSRLPAAQQLLANTTQLSGAVDRLTTAAAQLPDQLKAEREAIVASLESQQTQLSSLAGEVREALVAGSQMSTSLNTTFGTFDRPHGSVRGRRDERSAHPQRIARGTVSHCRLHASAPQVELTGRQLTELINSLQGMIGSTNLGLLAAQVSPVMNQAQVGTKAIVDFIFWRAVWFVLIVLAAGITYRVVSTRLTPPTNP